MLRYTSLVNSGGRFPLPRNTERCYRKGVRGGFRVPTADAASELAHRHTLSVQEQA